MFECQQKVTILILVLNFAGRDPTFRISARVHLPSLATAPPTTPGQLNMVELLRIWPREAHLSPD
jgi:hypothetical protein